MGVPIPLGVTPQGTQFVSAKSLQKNFARYDTVRLVGTAAGTVITNPINFFINPLNSRGVDGFVTKTFSQTNIRQSQKLEYPNDGTVSWITVSIIPVGAGATSDGVTQKIRAIQEDMLLEMKVDDVREIQDHVVRFAGVGLTGTPVMNGVAAESFLSGTPFISCPIKLSPVIPVPSRIPFSVRLFPNTSSAVLNQGLLLGQDIEFRVYLYGVFTRIID